MGFNDKFLFSEVSGQVIKSFFHVYNSLGFGFQKVDYVNALIHEFKISGMPYEHHKLVALYYDKVQIGEFMTDIIANNNVILMIEVDPIINPINAQILHNKLRSSIYEVGLLLNFGHSPEYIRKQFTNDIKGSID